jgi:ABC-type cobalamin transport system permease subunit
VLRPGGVVVVCDLQPHECEWMRERMGDLRLGIVTSLIGGPFFLWMLRKTL